jgi:ribosome-associated heat shock protein Hsp15
VALDRSVRVLQVLGFSERRGSPTDAAVLYKALEARQAPANGTLTPVAPAPGNRPDKRERRALRRVKADWN